jgi:hypothetical protein
MDHGKSEGRNDGKVADVSSGMRRAGRNAAASPVYAYDLLGAR